MRLRSWMALVLAVAVITTLGCSSSKKADETKPAAPAAAPATGPAPAPAPAPAKTWEPTKQIQLVVPYSAGGSTDLLARAVEKVWSKYVKQPLIVVNKAGAGGFEGREAVARGAADGYTLMMGYGSGEDLVSPQLKKTATDPFNDFAAVCRLSVHSVVVAVPSSSSYKSVKDIVDWSKSNKKPVTAAVSTAAGAVDIVMRGIGAVAGIEVTPIPHSGGSQAVTTLVGGQTTMGGGHPSEVGPQIKAGRIRPIAVATPQRDPVYPDVPTLIEQGINFSTWGSVKGIAVAKSTPPEVIAYYEGIFKKISEDDEFKKAMKDLDQPILYMNAKDYGDFMKSAYGDYGKLIKDLKITLQ